MIGETIDGQRKIYREEFSANSFAEIPDRIPFVRRHARDLPIGWARLRGIEWDSTPGPSGERFVSRFEIYHNGPMDEPDPQKWETEIWIKAKG